MKKFTTAVLAALMLLTLIALPVSASSPYQTYTYSINGTALYSPEAYSPATAVDSAYMGLTDTATVQALYPDWSETKVKEQAIAISSPSDLEVDEDYNVYIADTDNNRIVVLDRYYKLKGIIYDYINDQGVPAKLNAPQGVFVTKDKIVNGVAIEGRIYVCDTNNNQILTFSKDFEFLSRIPQPESELFGEGAVYKPVAVAVDQYDRMYVVSSTTYQGIIVMTSEGVFTEFIGAQKSNIGFWQRLWRRFQTDEQKAQSEAIVSTEFNNITINDEGFIYVTTSSIAEESVKSSITGKSKSGDFAPVKMLNAAGDEIMRRNGFYPPSGEVDMAKNMQSDTISGVSTVVDVAVGPEKTWSIIDQKRSKVFTYDYDGNLLFAFGDTGRQLGNISQNSLTAVTYQGDNMLLLDRGAKSFTVYERTPYGDIIAGALHHQNVRMYDKSVEDWQEILKRNSNFDTAYIGIGNALYRSGKYEESIDYFKSAYDTAGYSDSYQEIRKNWIAGESWIKGGGILVIVLVVVGVAYAIVQLGKFAKKTNKRIGDTKGAKKTYANELLYAFHVILHPFDGFWDMKHEKRGSVRAGTTILLGTLVAFYYKEIGSGYVYNPQGNYGTILSVSLSVLVPLALWVVANWCLTTLFDGEGSFKDIYVASTYALLPISLVYIPVTVMTNFALTKEMDIFNLICTFALIWVGLLIFTGTMVTHDYGLGKNVLTCAGTIVGMVCIMFIAILFTTLLGKVVSFVTNIVTELQYRA